MGSTYLLVAIVNTPELVYSKKKHPKSIGSAKSNGMLIFSELLGKEDIIFSVSR
jgi:hypothetical protein